MKAVIISESVLGAGSLAVLYGAWYSDYPRSSFHLINDNSEWRGMDKVGHAMTSYYVGKLGYESLKWAGLNEHKSLWYGGMIGFTYLGIVEVFDGFSSEWGASPGDLASNTLGSLLFIGQQSLWHEQRILLKWSCHMTKYDQYNQAQLGSNFPERLLKDYNGQTYWLSANLKSLAGLEGNFPPWLNLAIGYGAEGMTAPRSNPAEINGKPIPAFNRYSQLFLAPDIDLSRIPTRSKNLKLLLNAVGFIKFPLPTLEFNRDGAKFHWLYF